ncbi:MAG: hypothetical protein COT33_00700 [Candidatus Nealsonbacteria bacterium CG08_land_8_20_14_0_20_38_20]|uniref:Rod shape-determining protein MreD n=1 Tax=Candidatus Nealsonbacteria bacterium CG08_land_8_20_14_0_20_38_20 TaxID=1974705 RepID=A0A2H0YMH5_9BACT|nr:MAG: hypothetical protein COT33_00700 [Candidatus Nealsonbacteria bacterium CG08_land_8_20_14_0_20_38_20]
MVKKIITSLLFFYILALFQTSFLVHFSALNLILISIFFFNLFEKSEENFGLISALIGGFFLDIFSERAIGFYILILFLLSLFIKLILRRYIRIPIFNISK